MAVDHVGHFGQAATALRLAATGAMDGGRRHIAARGAQVAQGRVDRGVVQGIADANEQKNLPSEPEANASLALMLSEDCLRTFRNAIANS